MSGDNQSGAPGTQLTNPLRVAVTRGGSAVAGVSVNWSVTSGAAQVSPTTSTTDASGAAETRLTLGLGAAGTVTVQATVSGASGSPVSFTATALQATSDATIAVENDLFRPDNVLLTVGGRATFQYAASARDHNITPVTGNPQALPNQPTVRDGPFTYEAVFPVAGTYRYFCVTHGDPDSGMRGVIVVQ